MMSVCLSACNNSTPTEPIFMKFDIRVFFEKKYKFHYNLTTITVLYMKSGVHEERCT